MPCVCELCAWPVFVYIITATEFYNAFLIPSSRTDILRHWAMRVCGTRTSLFRCGVFYKMTRVAGFPDCRCIKLRHTRKEVGSAFRLAVRIYSYLCTFVMCDLKKRPSIYKLNEKTCFLCFLVLLLLLCIILFTLPQNFKREI